MPGTHITEVFHDLVAELAGIEALGDQIRNGSISALLQSLGEDTSRPEAITVFNSFLHTRSDCLCLPDVTIGDVVLVGEDRQSLPHQRITGLDDQTYLLTLLPAIPPVGYRVFNLVRPSPEISPVPNPVQAADGILENEFLRATFNPNGELISLWDKDQEREVLVDGLVGNHFQLFEDMPGKYDAWDIVATFADHEIALPPTGTLIVEECGPVRASLRLEKSVLKSRITQRISLYAGAHQLVFETQVYWQERQKLLKVGFPVEVNASHATYDIAFGSLRRPVHRNTSYDAAKFEVPAHQWMDVSDGGYGVSLLNDCKYGHEANSKLIRLTLLKGSVYPDPEADLGDHNFTYVLYPHAGSWEAAETSQHALNLNNPLTWCFGSPSADRSSQHSFLRCTASNVSLEAIKLSEDGQYVIVRLVERQNCQTRATLVFDQPVLGAWSCDLMENNEVKLSPVGNELPVTLKPFEILTLRLVFDY